MWVFIERVGIEEGKVWDGWVEEGGMKERGGGLFGWVGEVEVCD